MVLYGPKGCGRSTFFEALVGTAREINRGDETRFEAIYLRWGNANEVASAISSGSISEIISDAIKILDPLCLLKGRAVIGRSLSLDF